MRDFSDRGFQEEGYISENCFRSTALHRFKEARDFTHAPVFSGFDEDERAYRARLRRASGGERKLARSPKLAGKLPEAFDLSGRKRKIDNKRKMLMSRAFKDYTGFEFEGSGLDEHTRKEMARKKKKLGRDKVVSTDPERAKQDFLPVDIPATWEAMEECFRKGLAKAIGVSNFSTKKLHDLLQHAKITPAVDQVELHPLRQQEQLRDLCKRNCVQVIAWSRSWQALGKQIRTRASCYPGNRSKAPQISCSGDHTMAHGNPCSSRCQELQLPETAGKH
ncbi:hypothetical protein SELMODRAFT_404761 [Selaginella moellendorffii]|uniref:NADP-dependent oxidoreductase domain-containing protein n=1 Tax=Selaginella moellendorffii TaxID=88036 RepID=D8QWB0_SELML|nr:hypothetical protein SELMODRAFT_404761 [Selaginella moellendorffii]